MYNQLVLKEREFIIYAFFVGTFMIPFVQEVVTHFM